MHLFQSSLRLATKREETHGYVLWRKIIFIFSVIRGIIISKRFQVYNLHRKKKFDFRCWKVWGVLKCKNLWVWSGKCVKWIWSGKCIKCIWSNKCIKWVWNGKCGKLLWLQLLEGSILGQKMVQLHQDYFFHRVFWFPCRKF